MSFSKTRFPCRLSRNTLKALAFILMFIDHFGAMFFPSVVTFRVIGRGSFALFAYLIADGTVRTRHPEEMLSRLLQFAFISQIPYSLAFFGHISLEIFNIFFSLFLGAFLCFYLQAEWEGEERHRGRSILLLLILCVLAEVGGIDYGAYGLLLIVGFYALIRTPKWHRKPAFCLAANFALLYGSGCLYILLTGSSIQCLTVAVCPFLPCSRKKEEPWGKWVYWIYPAHLLVFCGVREIIKSYQVF